MSFPVHLLRRPWLSFCAGPARKARNAELRAVPREDDPSGEPDPGSGEPLLRVLLVEDNADDACMVESLLLAGPPAVRELLGPLDLAHAGSLGAALERLDLASFDAILLDLRLPDVQELEGVVRLRERVPDAPVVVLTGIDDQRLVLDSLRHGAQDYLIKAGLEAETLARSIRYAIERQRLVEAVEAAGGLGGGQRMIDLAGGVAHDIRNILGQILAHLQLALSSGDAGAALAGIQAAVSHGVELTEQLHSYSGGFRLELTPVGLSELAAEAVKLLRPGLPPGVMLETELASGLPPVAGDAGRLRRVVLNLAQNALDALDGRPGRVLVRTARPSSWVEGVVLDFRGGAPAGYCTLSVSDEGPGIDPARARRIFDPFYTSKSRGKGLGLAVVAGIVRAHGGAVALDSAPGAGTTFEVLLPAVAPA